MAQLAEQLICNQQVIGSSPIIGFKLHNYRGVEQSGSSSGTLPEGHRFKSCSRYFAQIAQLVEQRTENPRVAGSIPALGIYLA